MLALLLAVNASLLFTSVALTSRRDSNSSFELGGTLLMSGVSLLMSHDDDLKAGMADVSYIVAGSCVRAARPMSR